VNRRQDRAVAAVLAGGAWLTALVLTHKPPGPGSGVAVNDKLAHFLMYGALTAVLWRAWRIFGRSRRRRITTLAPLMLIYGAVDELTQPWFGRSAEWLDWLADAAGVAAALALCELALAWRRRRRLDRP
jgi:VanZ family protein